ncbi:hypothetical protein Tco_0094713, partial [Tanacetum coccineum]
MRPKRTIKPTKIFDNSSTNYSKNKQKNKQNNSKVVNDNMNGTVDFDGGIETEVFEQSKDKDVMGEETVASKENMKNVENVDGCWKHEKCRSLPI